MNDTILFLIINSGQCYHGLFRAADELLAMHPLAWWERPCLRLARWWAGRRLAAVLELVPVECRNEKAPTIQYIYKSGTYPQNMYGYYS